jgi:hypothetical protein
MMSAMARQTPLGTSLDRPLEIFRQKADPGSNEALLEALADDVCWTIPGTCRCRASRTYHGRADLVDSILATPGRGGSLGGARSPGCREYHHRALEGEGAHLVGRALRERMQLAPQLGRRSHRSRTSIHCFWSG